MTPIKKHMLFHWMPRHPIAGRLFAVVVLLVFPFIEVPLILWREREDIKEALSDSVAVEFLPWED